MKMAEHTRPHILCSTTPCVWPSMEGIMWVRYINIPKLLSGPIHAAYAWEIRLYTFFSMNCMDIHRTTSFFAFLARAVIFMSFAGTFWNIHAQSNRRECRLCEMNHFRGQHDFTLNSTCVSTRAQTKLAREVVWYAAAAMHITTYWIVFLMVQKNWSKKNHINLNKPRINLTWVQIDLNCLNTYLRHYSFHTAISLLLISAGLSVYTIYLLLFINTRIN